MHLLRVWCPPRVSVHGLHTQSSQSIINNNQLIGLSLRVWGVDAARFWGWVVDCAQCAQKPAKLRQCAYEPIVLLLHCNYLLYVVLDTTTVRGGSPAAEVGRRCTIKRGKPPRHSLPTLGFPILLEKRKPDKAVIA